MANKTSRKKKRFENLPLRRKYREQVGERCELKGLLPDEARSAVEKARPQPWYPRFVVHHIIHPYQQRRDLWSNIIVLDDIVHKWGHNCSTNELTVMCLYKKWEKSYQDEREFDVEELHDCLGSCPIAWVERQIRSYHEESEYFKMCLEIIESY